MNEKEAQNPRIVSNFEIHKSKNKVILYINPKIFPVSLVNKTAALFRDKAWVTLDSNEEEILVELKTKYGIDLEILAREFNNELLNTSTQYVSISQKSDALISRIKQVVTEFIKEEQGKITTQSVLTVGTILATLGVAQLVSASHLCAPPPDPGVGAGDGAPGGAACESGAGGGGGCCFASDQLVLTTMGFEEISRIKVESHLISYDENINNFTTSTVDSIIVHDGKQQKMANFSKDPMVKLSVKVGDNIKTMKVTDNHPYLDVANNVYKPLRELNIGSIIKTIEGKGIIVEKSIIIDRNNPMAHNQIVYNLNMKNGPHSFIVNGAVVHNGGEGAK